jgi:hypothetical protein
LVASWLSLWKGGSGTVLLTGLGSERLVFVLHALRDTDRMEDCKAVCLAGLELFPPPSTNELTSSMREVLLQFAIEAARETDNPEEGLLHAETALAETIDAIERFGETADRLRTLAAVKTLLAELRIGKSELELDIILLGESVATCQRVVDDFGESAQRLGDVSKSKADLAFALRQKDDNATAIKLLDEALEIAERVIAVFGEHVDWLMNVAEIKERLAKVKADVDQPGQAGRADAKRRATNVVVWRLFKPGVCTNRTFSRRARERTIRCAVRNLRGCRVIRSLEHRYVSRLLRLAQVLT